MKPKSLDEAVKNLKPPNQQEIKSPSGNLPLYAILFFYQPAILMDEHGLYLFHRPSFALVEYYGAVIDYIPPGERHTRDRILKLYEQNQIPIILITSLRQQLNDLADYLQSEYQQNQPQYHSK